MEGGAVLRLLLILSDASVEWMSRRSSEVDSFNLALLTRVLIERAILSGSVLLERGLERTGGFLQGSGKKENRIGRSHCWRGVREFHPPAEI
jgi:hypothetical protein